MGGSAVARKLVEAGQDVLLVEAGDVEAIPLSDALVGGEYVGRPFRMPATRCIELGGTSNLWHGLCAPLDDIDFEPRPWIENSGWPLRRSDLAAFYDQAAEALGVPGASHWETDRVAPDIRERFRDFAFDESILENKLFQFRKPPVRLKDGLLQLAKRENFRCLVNAPALELMLNENGTRIEYLIVGAGGGTIQIFADVFIVCAGSLETPRLLLNSNRRFAAGVGNSHDLVGKYLLDHPNAHFCKLGLRRSIKAPLYSDMPLHAGNANIHLVTGLQLRPRQQRQARLPNNHVYIRPSLSPARIDDDLLLSFMGSRGARNLTLKQIKAILTHRDIFYRILIMKFGLQPTYRYGDLFFLAEQLPNRDSCVRLSGQLRDRYGYAVAQIDWQLSEADFSAFENYSKLVLGQGLKSGQYSLARVDEPTVWRNAVASAAHHLGTARMAENATQGVVDSDLRVFGMDNLFICDGSVFPTAGSANPSLTITALGLRLAAHLNHRRAPVVLQTAALNAS
jgi:choline dehydrogenase-like flavoprotein